MARWSALPLAVILFLSLFSYCIALLVSREAPIPYLVAGGFGALALMVASLYGLWFKSDFNTDGFEKRISDEPFFSTDNKSD
jgi:hypothetical protein